MRKYLNDGNLEYGDLEGFDPFNSKSFEDSAEHLFNLQLQSSLDLALFSKKAHVIQRPYHYFPATFFSGTSVYLSASPPEIEFRSSGTSSVNTAIHKVADISIYKQSLMKGFETAFPGIQAKQPVILALLPSYLERGGSSLVFMVKTWMDSFGAEGSNFFLNDFSALKKALTVNLNSDRPIILIGVTYALLDFFHEFPVRLAPETILIETGGMKGRKAEMLRQDVHSELKRQTGLKHISSEYGMTELLSQAYSHEDGLFTCPPWMRVEIRDLNDIHLSVPLGKTGRICIVDLANKWSCAFLATGDVGRLHSTGYFEVIGRADTSGSRGCSLMYSFS